METPPAWKGKNIPSNLPFGGENLFPNRLKLRRVNNRKRIRRSMTGVGVESAAQAAALGIGIIITPIFIGPTKNIQIKGLRLIEVFNAFSRKFNEVKAICTIFFSFWSIPDYSRLKPITFPCERVKLPKSSYVSLWTCTFHKCLRIPILLMDPRYSSV